MVRYCSVRTCFNNETTHRFHSFPERILRDKGARSVIGIHPHKAKLFEKWARFCDDPSIYQIKSKVGYARFVCDIHFEPEAFQNPSTREKLVWYAVPTLDGAVTDPDSQCLLVPDLSEGIMGSNGKILPKRIKQIKQMLLQEKESQSGADKSNKGIDSIEKEPNLKVKYPTSEKTQITFNQDLKFGSIKVEPGLDVSTETVNETETAWVHKPAARQEPDASAPSMFSDDSRLSGPPSPPSDLDSFSAPRNKIDTHSLRDNTVPAQRHKHSAQQQNVFTKDVFFCGECQSMFNSFEEFVVHKLTKEEYKMTFERAHLLEGLWIPKLYKKSELDSQISFEEDNDGSSSPNHTKDDRNAKRSKLAKDMYPCSKCDHSFFTKAPLIKHYFKMHGND